MRVVLDTDVVVAGLRSRRGSSRAWLRAALHREVDLVLTVPLVVQYEAVLLQPATLAAIGGTAERVERLLDLLCAVGRPVEISYLWRPVLRDPDDEMVLEAAVHGRVDRLLTFNLRDFAGGREAGADRAPGPGLAGVERRPDMTQANYALRLQAGLKAEAERVAKAEGTTLNQLINVAVAEKLSALRDGRLLSRARGAGQARRGRCAAGQLR